MNEFESLLEELDDLIEDAWRLPLSNGKIVIEREELARIVNGLHTHYPVSYTHLLRRSGGARMTAQCVAPRRFFNAPCSGAGN